LTLRLPVFDEAGITKLCFLQAKQIFDGLRDQRAQQKTPRSFFRSREGR
jgi:hypothetical protein